MDKRQFAEAVIAAIHRTGETATITYNAATSELGQDGKSVASLDNVYAAYCRAGKDALSEVITRVAQQWCLIQRKLPDDFADASHDILPVVHELDYFTTFGTPLAHHALTRHHGVGAAFDWPEAITGLDTEQLKRWGISYAELFDCGLRNLRRTSSPTQFMRREPGVYTSTRQDGYDSSLILLPDLFEALHLNGDPVAMIATRDALLITGADDEKGLKTMADTAYELASENRFRSCIPMRYVNGAWESYHPPHDHPAAITLRFLFLHTFGRACTRLKSMLDKQYEEDHSNLQVSFYEVAPTLQAYCSWTADNRRVLQKNRSKQSLEQEPRSFFHHRPCTP